MTERDDTDDVILPGRRPGSPYRYDRAEIRRYLEQHGREAALERWPHDAVDPIARLLGLIRPYRKKETAINPERIQLLGTKPDHRLAAEWGAPTTTVAKAREMLGIRPFNEVFKRVRFREKLDAISDRDLQRLTLKQLEVKTGLSMMALSAERRRRRIVKTNGRGRRHNDEELLITQMRKVAILALRMAFPRLTLHEIAQALGVTREYIRQLELELAVEKDSTPLDPEEAQAKGYELNREIVKAALRIAGSVTEELGSYAAMVEPPPLTTLSKLITKTVYMSALRVLNEV